RIAGTPPNTAQSPKATRILQRSRILMATSSLYEFAIPPSRMPTSTPSLSGSFKSVIGVARRSTNLVSSMILSSMSKKDIWQPAQPASQSEATFGFAMFFLSYSFMSTAGSSQNDRRNFFSQYCQPIGLEAEAGFF